MSESGGPDHIGRVLGGRYRLVALIGIGSSGEVYLADDTQLRRQVAVKVLHRHLADDEVFLRRFRAEAQVAAGLTHQHIVSVFDWGEDEVPYIVTEYLSGGSLRSMLDVKGAITPSQALLIGLEASRGLDFAHRRGVVQRDIKPANILFDGDGHVRIADFGLAKALAEASATEPSGQMVGTVRYASPEQAQGKRVEPASDVYSLGLVLIEAVTGELPFDADTPIATLMARVDTEVALDGALGALRGPIGRACAVDPAQRPDAGELSVALMAAAENMPRPEPLPLVGAIAFDPIAASNRDKTMLAGATDAPEVVAPDADDGRRRRRRNAEPAAPVPADDDSRRRRWPLMLLALVLLAGAGVATWLAIDRTEVATDLVPDAVGLTPAEFRAEVGDFWEVREALVRVDGSVPGTIVSTNPPPGTELEQDAVIEYFVSQGNELKPVPANLVGLTLEEAEAFLAGAGLELGTTDERFDEQAVPGVVVEVLTTATELPGGEAVDLVVSRGPRPRQIPETLIGLTFEEAQAQLASQSLQANRLEAFDNAVPAGIVIGVSPNPGRRVPRDSAVDLTVSLGPEPVVIPDVTGLDVPSAAAALRNAGLTIGDTDGPPDTTVIATDPGPGTTVAFGFPVRIITSEFG
jgi:eukaryotic-like serine/threonine-protein kinase